MFCFNRKFLFLLLVFTVHAPAHSWAASPSIKVGVGEAVITPPVGIPMAGYSSRKATGTHDDLYARSLVLEDAKGNSTALITVALLNLSETLMDSIRAEINRKTGIPVSGIVISCTHTHSGPSYSGLGEANQKKLVDNTVASAVHAWNGRVPGRIGSGSAVELDLAMNDRKMEYGGLHPDPEVGIVKIENAQGKLLGVLFNYGCHPSTLDLHNLEYTEDWPYYSIIGVKEKLGKNIWAAYFQSAQGNVKVGYTAELSAVGAEMGIRNYWYAEHKGRMLSRTVLGALDSIKTSEDVTVDSVSGYYDLPLRKEYPVSVAEAEKIDREARARLEEMEKSEKPIGRRVLDRYKVDVFLSGLQLSTARWIASNQKEAERALIQAVRIGDTVFSTFPCEVFAEIGLKVKQASPFDKTYILGLASGHGNYLPTEEEYLEGGYAAVWSKYNPKCVNILINESLEHINKLK